MRAFLSTIALMFTAAAPPAVALCTDSISLDDPSLTPLRAKVATVPYHQGLLWQVEKGGVTSVLFGTMHLYDPRHDDSFARIQPLIDQAERIYLEFPKSSEADLMALMSESPDLYLLTEGPSLIDRLGPEAWDKLKADLDGTQIAPFMAAKMQPWFLGLSMMMPNCAVEDFMMGLQGIDWIIETHAEMIDLPIVGLDTPDLLLSVLADEPVEKQVDDMRWSLMLDLPMTPPDDATSSLYFAEETQVALERGLQIFEDLLGDLDPADKARFDLLVSEMLTGLIDTRNRAWLDRLEVELTQTPSFVAVGALHLPGEQGLLHQLEQAGFTVSALSMSQP